MIQDIVNMHSKFGVHAWKADNIDNKELMRKWLQLRMNMIREEFQETENAIASKDPEEVVDGLIDLLVFTLGTLEVMDVDIQKAWEQVMSSNMMKETGVKPGRPNPLGLPDLLKPSGWIPPSHEGNHGDTERFL